MKNQFILDEFRLEAHGGCSGSSVNLSKEVVKLIKDFGADVKAPKSPLP